MAPKVTAGGIHSLPQTKPKPNLDSEGHELMVRDRTIPNSIAIVSAAMARVRLKNSQSPILCRPADAWPRKEERVSFITIVLSPGQ